MASTSEVGHAKNVANFQDLIQFVTGYGATYNPSKNSLKLPQLVALKEEGDNKLTEVIAQNTNYNNSVNERFAAFSNVKTLGTRLINALQTTEASKETIDDAKGFNRKLQGKRASKIETPADPNAPAPKTISSSQQSYDQLIQHLAGLKAVLKAEPSYTPNETDLQIGALELKIDDLNAKNTAVTTAYANVSNARIDRDKTLYTKTNNLIETAQEVKKYVKSVFGATSPEYAQISGLKFTIKKD